MSLYAPEMGKFCLQLWPSYKWLLCLILLKSIRKFLAQKVLKAVFLISYIAQNVLSSILSNNPIWLNWFSALPFKTIKMERSTIQVHTSNLYLVMVEWHVIRITNCFCVEDSKSNNPIKLYLFNLNCSYNLKLNNPSKTILITKVVE